jgi:hypothetical protein
LILTLPVIFKFNYLFILYFLLYATNAYSYTLSLPLLDITSRIDVNSIGLAGLYWMWTNAYYLYTLFISIILLVVVAYFNISRSSLYVILLVYFYILFFELCTNINHSILLSLNQPNLSFYNLLLNNSINKLHPALIYYSWIFLAVIYFVYLYSSLKYRTILNLVSTTLVLLYTLFLGGWWAYQEGSWGGWWNWDPSEMFGLFILSVIISISHAIKHYNFYNLSNFKTTISLLFLYYSFLQLNFSLISHNFGIRQGDLVDFRVFYLLVFIYAIYFSYIRKYVFFVYSNLTCNLTLKINIKAAAIILAIFLISYITTSELLSNLLWKIFSIDFQNNIKLLSVFNFIIIILVLLSYSYIP